MKSFMLRAVAAVALLLSLQPSHAAPKPPKVFGGFEVGKTFTFTVSSRIASATQGFSVINPAPIPKGTPDYQIGQQVTFTIGKKGELVAPGMKILFQGDAGTSNAFVNKPKKGAQPSTAIVYKNPSTQEPTSVALAFYTVKVTNRIPTVTQVFYTLN